MRGKHCPCCGGDVLLPDNSTGGNYGRWALVMRCYFLKRGHIAAVEYLHRKTDEGRVAEARKLFELKGQPFGADGFEVWDGGRFVYRYPEQRPDQKA